MPLSKIKKADMPIITYRIGHTTPKVQSGGAKEGLDKSAYQVLTESIVTKEPRKPVRRHKDTEQTNLLNLFIIHHPETELDKND
jgi:hypothetical protein